MLGSGKKMAPNIYYRAENDKSAPNKNNPAEAGLQTYVLKKNQRLLN